MNATAGFVFYALLLILPISALAARRLPIGNTIKLVLAWIAIFAIAFLLVSWWQGGFAQPDTPPEPITGKSDLI